MAMSVREAARALGLGRETVYEMVRQNQIPNVKVGRRVIIPRPALEAWLAGAAERGEDGVAQLSGAAPGPGRHASPDQARGPRGRRR